MEREYTGNIRRTVSYRISSLLVVFWLCSSGLTTVFAQAGDPAFEARVDSLKQVYMNQGISEAWAEKRARDIVQGEYDRNQLIVPTGGTNPLNPANGSIAVNRDAKYVAFTPTQLVDSVFVKSSVCSSVSNVTLKAHGWNSTTQQWTNLDGTNRGLGYYNRTNTVEAGVFEFAEGLVLATGGLRAIEGPNIDAGSGVNMIPDPVGPVLGDNDLVLLEPGITNVSVLEFDFVPASSMMTFKYIFASEEYLEYANSGFNDVFGFFISGPGITGGNIWGNKNIATLPIAGDPFVAINNINWGYVQEDYHNSASSAGNVGPPAPVGFNYSQVAQNPAFYINIPGSWAQSPAAPVQVLTPRQDSLRMSIELDGRTVVLTASCIVIPCQQYHLKLAIANTGDQRWQSAVFLEAHSFEIGANMDNYGSMNPRQTIIYRGCTENQVAVYRPCTDDIKADTTVYLTYSGTAYNDGNITSVFDLSQPFGLPDSIVIPAGIDTVYIPYSVNTVNVGAGHRTFNIHSEVRGVCGGTYTLSIDLYDTSNPDDFQATATPACPGQNNGTITIATGTGGSGSYESSIDGGLTWQTSTLGYTYTGLPSDDYTVFIRDWGGCSYVTRYVTTIFPRSLSGSIGLCPPTYTTTLTAPTGAGFTYQWYKDGTAIGGATSQTYTATALGAYYVLMNNGVCSSVRSDTMTLSSNECLWAVDDYSQTLRGMPDTISVLANDMIPASCPTPVVDSILTPQPQLEGLAYINSTGDKIIFIPAPGFTGEAVFVYQLVCGVDTVTATVTVYVHDFPDNVIDADCVGTPTATEWGIDENYLKSEIRVNSYGQPYVGDVDGCGRNEVVIWNNGAGGSGRGDSILIFNDDLTVKYKIYAGGVSGLQNSPPDLALAFAKTDPGNTAADIFAVVGSSYATNSVLKCFTFNGTGWSEKWTTTAGAGGMTYAAAINIGDINNDGNVMLYVDFKIFNAKTGALLLTLPSTPKGQRSGSRPVMNLLADMDNDGTLEAVTGFRVYKLHITNLLNATGNNYDILYELPASEYNDYYNDGFASVVDINLDGYLDVIISTNRISVQNPALLVWNPQASSTKLIGAPLLLPGTNPIASRVFAGDVDNDGYPDLAVVSANRITCFKNNNGTGFTQHWTRTTGTNIYDSSAETYMCMFDFNQDGRQEIVYRDEQRLHIIDGDSGNDVSTISCFSPTTWEGAIVAELNGDGHAQIIVTGNEISTNTYDQTYLRVYNSAVPGTWAPARPVWNQYSYNAVNINADLSVPRYQLHPSTLFPNGQRPFNSFLKQQTLLNNAGDLFWPMADADTVPSLTGSVLIGDSVCITVGVANRGDATLGSPVYAAVYWETSPQTFTSTNRITVDSADILIKPDSIELITIGIADITPYMSYANLVIRLNDNGGVSFPYQPECIDYNNVIVIPNPAYHRMMKKDAILLPSFSHNGSYSNPVATLFTDIIEYTITAFNGYPIAENITIIDTLPTWLIYDNMSSSPNIWMQVGTPPRDMLIWTVQNVPAMTSTAVSFQATPESGVNASQPLFINKAYVVIRGDTVGTNVTYHQGAGFSVVTFSADFGGKLYNATEQALDYRTTPASGIVIVPDEGYRFAGWSHADYLSLRGETIKAQSGIMHYDTLTVYGDVELRADFELEVYPIVYHLNGGRFPDPRSLPPTPSNRGGGTILNDPFPIAYTIESGDVTLETPEKAGDVFVGWTGSNGDEPQLTVTIPARSTGERVYYANFLYTDRKRDLQPVGEPETDRIWAAGDALYVRASNSGSVLRIYSEDGILQKQQIILQPGESKYRLTGGLYIVTINNSVGHIIRIE